MRYFEIVGGLRIPVLQGEGEILNRAEKEKLAKKDLKPHEQELARRMTVRGVLRYADEEKQTHFIPNVDPTATRF